MLNLAPYNNSLRLFLLGVLILGVLLGSYQAVWSQRAQRVLHQEQLEKSAKTEEDNTVFVQIIWDVSANMEEKNGQIDKFNQSKQFLSSFINKINPDIKLSLRLMGARKVMDLDDSFKAVCFDENREVIRNFVENVQPLGKAAIGYSLEKAREDLQGFSGTKKVILVTAGVNQDRMALLPVIDNLKKANIVLHVAHVGEKFKNTMEKLAIHSGGQYFNIQQEAIYDIIDLK